MDSLILMLVELYFFLLGRRLVHLLRLLGLKDLDFSESTMVKLGFVVTVLLCIAVGFFSAMC